MEITKSYTNLVLQLGETFNLNADLSESAELLGEVVVTGRAGIDATKTGAAQSINSERINDIPSISHSIADITRLNPQISVSNSGAMSFAGVNNRYNSFMIDGAMNNDVFGLTSNGSNGGQAGAQPVSMETIEQIQVNVAPFDVRQSGFTGGAINAITKSGTNQFHGSAYGYGYNEKLIGRHYKLNSGKYSDPYEDEHEYQIGFTVGGPIIKNKLFFFANYEKANQEYPNNYGLDSNGAKFNSTYAKDILSDIKALAAEQGIDYTGTFSNPDHYTKSDKAGAKIDWNINDFNKFSFKWSLVSAKQKNSLGNISSLNSSDYSYDFVSKTNSFVAELQSRISPTISNEARTSYVRVRDQRDPGAPFPMITIYNVGDGTVNIGNERSSMANSLDQDVFTLEDNLTWYAGNHTLTFGTHNEFYDFANLFIQDAYGSYYFNSYDDFKNRVINRYRYGVANTDITGSERWKAQFGAGQLGFYAQDKWDAANNFTLTYGLRMEVPLFFDTPAENAGFNQYAASKGWNVKTNHRLSSAPLWSPRVGFRWDINNDRQFILRGGVGLFTGRIPYVWLSNNFSNTGVQLSTYDTRNTSDLNLILDPARQGENAARLAASGSQTVNVYEDDFKFAQNLRANLAIDFNLFGIDWTLEGIYSKTLNDIYYKNLAYDTTGKTLGSTYSSLSYDNRPMFTKVTTDTPYSYIYGLYNTSKGYTYNLSVKGEKKFDFGLDLMASYTFTKSKSVNNGTSSVAQSNWNYNYTYKNSNDPELGNSAFNVPHRIKASVFYHFNYGKERAWQTTVGLIYQAQSGTPYSLYYYGDINGDSSNGNDLLFIPTDAQIDQMEFKANSNYTAEQQRANFKQWIANDSYMSEHRGEYYKRYANNLPFEHHFDIHLAEKFSFKVGQQTHALELGVDILNVANLLNKKWGHTYGDSFGYYASPVTYSGNGQFQFLHDGNYNTFTYSDYYSRWRGQVSLKYTF